MSTSAAAALTPRSLGLFRPTLSSSCQPALRRRFADSAFSPLRSKTPSPRDRPQSHASLVRAYASVQPPCFTGASTTKALRRLIPRAAPVPSCGNTFSATRAYSGTRSISSNVALRSLAFFFVTAGGLALFFRSEKARVKFEQAEKMKQDTKSIGRAKIGGPFKLIDHEGRVVTNEDFLGRFQLYYFGFSHCPDICPEELEKMTDVVDLIKANPLIGDVITPIFITCDPERDGVAETKEYIRQFHPDLIGLTGTLEDIEKACKQFRIYFSAPPDVQPGEDYLVDHSIFFYLMDPHGLFIDAYSREWTAGEVCVSIEDHIRRYRAEGGKEGKEAVMAERAKMAADANRPAA